STTCTPSTGRPRRCWPRCGRATSRRAPTGRGACPRTSSPCARSTGSRSSSSTPSSTPRRTCCGASGNAAVRRLTKLVAAANAGPAEWLVAALTTFAESVLSLVPSGFAAYVRIFHPALHLPPSRARVSPLDGVDRSGPRQRVERVRLPIGQYLVAGRSSLVRRDRDRPELDVRRLLRSVLHGSARRPGAGGAAYRPLDRHQLDERPHQSRARPEARSLAGSGGGPRTRDRPTGLSLPSEAVESREREA